MLPRLLVTGGSGFLGSALCARAAGAWQVSYTCVRRELPLASGLPFRLDLRDAGAVLRVVRAARPEVIVHTAFTAEESLLDAVVVAGSETVARAAADVGAALLHVSTDMVFDGESPPYDEASAPAPLSPYGRAKAEAEQRVRAACAAAVVARASLLYSLSPPDPRTARDAAAARAGRRLVLFTDERRCPAEVMDVARALLLVARRLQGREAGRPRAGLPPVVHLVGPESLSRHELGLALFDALGVPTGSIVAGAVRDSGLARPRDLTLVARHTPRELVGHIRPLASVIAGLAG